MNYLLAPLVVILQSITLLATMIGSRSGGCNGGMKKAILSLALGVPGLGMAGFGTMGMLTELEYNVGILAPAVGHMISYYALGVVVGAPIATFLSNRYSLKHILLLLVALCIIGNAILTLFSSYLILATGQLVFGFPHGAFLGVGAIVLLKIIGPSRVAIAVAGMVSGMTVTNLLGIPLGTYLSQKFSWRYTFLLITVSNIAVMASVYLWMPDICDEVKGKLREQFHFLCSPTPWLIFAAAMFGNVGVFAWFNCIKPYMMFISGFSEAAMTFIVMLVGPGMMLGNVLSGRTSGRYSLLHVVTIIDSTIALILLMLPFFGGMKTTSLISVFICRAGLLALSAPLQILLLQNAKGRELLSAVGGQIVFNFGGAIGAYCGGMVLTLGLAYNYMALPTAPPSSAVMSSLLLYGHYGRQQAADSPVLVKPVG